MNEYGIYNTSPFWEGLLPDGSIYTDLSLEALLKKMGFNI